VDRREELVWRPFLPEVPRKLCFRSLSPKKHKALSIEVTVPGAGHLMNLKAPELFAGSFGVPLGGLKQ
jgi:hypothetical protein